MLSLEWRREDHAGGGAAIGQKFFDEVLELGHGREDDLEHEGVVAGEVVAFLHGVESGEEFEEGFVSGSFAGEADEGGNGVAERGKVDVGAVAANDLEAFEAAEAFGGSGGRETDSTAEFGDGEASVGIELLQELFID